MLCRSFLLLMVVLSAAMPAVAQDSPTLSEARLHYQKGRYAEALEAYKTLSATDESGKATVGLSRVHEIQGRLDEATEVLTKALEESPKHALLHARLAEVLWHRGRYDEARKAADAAVKLEADQPLARWVQAEIDAAEGRLDEADNGYRWFVRFYNRTQPKDAETLLLVAQGAAQYARWNGSTQIFGFMVNTLCPDALADEKASWQAYYVSGTLLLEKYNRAEAIPEFQSALEINPHAPDVHAALALAALQKHEFRRALTAADRALEVNPRHVAALNVKAQVALASGESETARALLERARKVNPLDEPTLARLASVYLIEDGLPAEDPFKNILANLDAADQIDADSRFAKLVVGLVETNPKPGLFLTVVGHELASRRKFTAAERCFKKAMAVMPQLSQPQTELGMLYMQTGRTDEARRVLDGAFKADPYHVRVSNMRKVLGVLEGYETIATDHFVIRVDSQADGILGRYMADYLEEIYPALAKKYGYEPPARTQFEIFANAKGVTAHQWFSARMVGLPWIQTIGASTGMMVALASPNAAAEPFNWARVVKHEYVHILTLQSTNFNIPHWFTEALAVTEEGYPRPAVWNRLLARRVPEGDVPILDELNRGFTKPETPDDWQYAYCQSKLHARYIAETFGPEAIEKMLAAYRKGLPTDKVIARALQVDRATFASGYRKFVTNLVAMIRTGSGEDARSLEQLKQEYETDKSNLETAAAFAMKLLERRERRAARDVATAVIEKDKTVPLAAAVLADLELLAEDEEAAERYLTAAFAAESPHPAVTRRLARIRLGQSDFKGAAEMYERGRKTALDKTEWLRGLAICYLKLEETDKLIAVLEDLATIEADDGAVRKKLAELYAEKKDYANVVRYGRLALHVDVMDPQTHRLLGRAYEATGKPKRAAREYEVVLKLSPDDDEAKSRLNALRKGNPATP